MSEHSREISPPPLKRRRLSVAQFESRRRPPATRIKSGGRKVPFRLYFWNINGIAPFLYPDTPAITNFFTSTSLKLKQGFSQSPESTLRTHLRQWQWPEVVGLQEVKIGPSDCKALAAIRRNVNHPIEHETSNNFAKPLYDVYLGLPRDKYNATGFGGKIYGVCMLVKQSGLNAHVKSVDWDLEGRILICEYSDLGIAIINVYAVNGTEYDYRDPETGKVIGTRHTWKRKFHTLLANEVQSYEASGWHVIVAGDINISRERQDSFPELRMGQEHVKNRTDFEKKFMAELGMLDTFRLLHGDERKYTFRPTSKAWGAGGDRVDMILATKKLEGHISEADILDSELDRGPSDHVPHFVNLNL